MTLLNVIFPFLHIVCEIQPFPLDVVNSVVNLRMEEDVLVGETFFLSATPPQLSP